MEMRRFKKEHDHLFEEFGNRRSTTGPLKLNLEQFESLFQFFQAGESFYFTMDHYLLDFEYVNKNIENILGYKPSEFNVSLIVDIVHPDDRPYLIEFGTAIKDFFMQLIHERKSRYKMRYDLRYRKKDGSYCRMLYQGAVLELDDTGMLLRTFGSYTDITYLKEQGVPALSFIGMDGEPSYVNVVVNKLFSEAKDDLTERERQVLRLLAEGKLSKEIASLLQITKETVDKHRKNMLRKKNLSNTGALISTAIRYGWI